MRSRPTMIKGEFSTEPQRNDACDGAMKAAVREQDAGNNQDRVWVKRASFEGRTLCLTKLTCVPAVSRTI